MYGVCGDVDNCPDAPNALQTDADADGLGDFCDACNDPDGDGWCEELVLLEFGSRMRYLPNGIDPGIGLLWTTSGFDDGAWTPGSYGVGYEVGTGAENLIATPVPPHVFSVYTRAEFYLPDATAVRGLSFGADYDDGIAVWLNGTEVHRSSEMPAGAPDWNTNAALHESSNGALPDYGAPIDLTTRLPLLQTGRNVLAVGVWNNAAATSSDLVLVPRLALEGPSVDNCPALANPSQTDADGDGRGDACDPCPTDPDDLCG